MSGNAALLAVGAITAFLIGSGSMTCLEGVIGGLLILLIGWLAVPFGKPIRKAIESYVDEKLGFRTGTILGVRVFLIIVLGLYGLYLWRGETKPSEALAPIQKQAESAKPPLDYGYGLAFDVEQGYDKHNSENQFEVRLRLKNKVDGPLKFRLEQMITAIAPSIVMSSNKEGIIAKGDTILVFPAGGLTAEQFKSLQGNTTGRLDAIILYGHPDSGFSRRLLLSLHLDVIKWKVGPKRDLTVGMNWLINTQSDGPIAVDVKQ